MTDRNAINLERHTLLGRLADELFEHCDCVVVMGLFNDEERKDESFYVYRGGSHAAVGLADEFIHIRRRERGPVGGAVAPPT